MNPGYIRTYLNSTRIVNFALGPFLFMYIQVALPQPLRRTFDYLVPNELKHLSITPGMRVSVPWGPRELIGVVIQRTQQTDVPIEKLRPFKAILDPQPIINASMMQFCLWAANYYHYPIGETMTLALPPYLRKSAGKKMAKAVDYWRLTAAGQEAEESTFKRSPKQWQALSLLKATPENASSEIFKNANIPAAVLKTLVTKGLVEKETLHEALSLQQNPVSTASASENKIILNDEQLYAIDKVCDALNTFSAFVLDGVTGSGKTEVYLRIIEKVLASNKQALVLVPEIGLTPQTVARFQTRFPQTQIAVFHSNLNETARLHNWMAAQQGHARIIIGTRSALFTPLPALGVIIIDEAHDASFKQQEGLRYSARDLAMKRGQLEKAPVLLGSATHTLETLYQVKQQRYQLLRLTQRAGNAVVPTFEVVDIRHQVTQSGLSTKVIQTITENLQQKNQVLIFLNRRGFAPVLICHDCGWVAGCHRCDARMTLHYDPYQLHCHHCDKIQPVDKTCPKCRSQQLLTRGSGTERIEQFLKQQFPHIGVARIDRDTTRKKFAMQTLLDDIHTGTHQLLIGTQMLAKGHHFPNVTLVVILDVDYGFCSSDFRASERLAQLIVQVSGRAGRADKHGHVMLQTHHPDHPLLLTLLQHGYNHFADAALHEREIACLPPYSSFAVIRAEAAQRETVMEFLQQVREAGQRKALKEIMMMGPIPALMERRAGVFRAQLIIQSSQRSILQSTLKELLPMIEALKLKNKVRWHVDVDPWDVF